MARSKSSPLIAAGQSRLFVLKTAEEYAADTKTAVVNSKKYFKHRRLQVRDLCIHDKRRGLKLVLLPLREGSKPQEEFLVDWFCVCFSFFQDIVMSYPHSRKLSKEEIDKEMDDRKVFLHFIFGLLELNPWKRWTARQAADHPFITGR